MATRPTNSTGAQLAIFNTPELLSLIFNASLITDCARLANTSRTIFTAAAPIIWKDLEGVGPLLKLLQATCTSVDGGELYTLPYASVADFSRFDVYAPLVKTLRVHPELGDLVSVNPWRTLILRTHDCPLLPNLSSLMLESAKASYGSQLMWISVLASPSLRIIKSAYDDAPNGAQISFSTMSIISKLITERCPSLHTLGLFPGMRWVHRPNKPALKIGEEDDDEDTSLLLMLGKPFHHYLGNMQNLRFLTTNTTLINPAPLLSLSKLPFLESLDICSLFSANFQTGVLEVPLPAGSFPALKRLAVRFLGVSELSTLWNMLPLVENLTCLEFQFNFFEVGDPDSMASWFSSTFFPLVCARSPHVNNLAIKLADGDSESDDPYEFNLGFYEQMALLPLQYVSFRWLSSSVADTEAFYARLGVFWPEVIELNLHEEYVQPKDLRHFAALSKLECLTISLACPQDWNPPALSPELWTHGPRPLHTLQQNSCGGELIPNEYAKPIAKYLLSFWPNLQHFSCINVEYAVTTRMTFKLMEEYASKLRMLREIRRKVIAQFGPEMAEAMVPGGLDDL